MKGVRFYEDFEDARKRRSTGNCIAVFVDDYIPSRGGAYEAYAAVLDHPNAMPGSTAISIPELRRRCKRVPEQKARCIHPNLFTWLDPKTSGGAVQYAFGIPADAPARKEQP